MNQAQSTLQAPVQHNPTPNNQPTTICQATGWSGFPTGLNIRDYPGGKVWSKRRWAWEFLRRNPDFQKLCHEVDDGQISLKEIQPKLAESFGLLKFKHYRDNYQPSRPSFSSAQVNFWSNTETVQSSKRRTVKIFLASGEIIVRASLRHAIHLKNRNALLNSIAKLLQGKSEIWGEQNNVNPSQFVQRGDLLPLIRILDLVAHMATLPKSQRMTRTKIFAMLYPSLTWTPPGQPHSPGQFDKPFNERWRVARRYMKPEWYLDLAATQ